MKHFFTERKDKFQQQAREYSQKYNRISILRVAVFILIAVTLFLLIRNGWLFYALITAVILLSGFGVLINYHHGIRKQERLYQNLSRINEDEVDRLQLKLQNFDDGLRYLDERHPYSFDLDIFGKHSLYQLVSRCTTLFGKDRVAKDLQEAQSADIIKSRQEAIGELRYDVDWRQNLEAIGRDQQKINSEDLDAFYDWLEKAEEIPHLKLLSRFAMAIWVGFAVVFYFVITGQIWFYWLFAFNILVLPILGPKLRIIQKITFVLSRVKDQLAVVNDIILRVEQRKYESRYLQGLSSAFQNGKMPASGAIRQLSSIVEFLNNRGNAMYILANAFLMIDFVFLQKAERWKSQYASHVKEWFAAIAQFEVILSYAGFAFANKEYAFPAISEKEYKISCKEMGHPLIEKDKLVKNDFAMHGKGAITLITGSNMAGKSTFLRSLGINLVLAQAGAPVCASEFTFIPVKVFTSMRTKDNLEENISTFYAELLRINTLLKSISDNQPTFFLLDEILKGTNSHDRHKGAEALMQQLNTSNAFGLVSTHDVELHSLSGQMEHFENFSFHSKMIEGNLRFDYRLQQGPCLDFNAIELMKKMGISISN